MLSARQLIWRANLLTPQTYGLEPSRLAMHILMDCRRRAITLRSPYILFRIYRLWREDRWINPMEGSHFIRRSVTAMYAGRITTPRSTAQISMRNMTREMGRF